MQLFKERVLQGLLDRDSLLWVQVKHFVKKVGHFWANLGRQNTSYGLLFVLLKSLDILQSMLVLDLTFGGFVERTAQLDNQIYLLDVVLAREENLAGEDLVKGAPSRPHVHLPRVLLRGEHDFGGAIKARHHILSQILLLLLREAATQAKVTYFEVTIFVD